MTEETWKFAYASMRGTSHIRSDTPCQDYGLCELLQTPNEAVIFIGVVADGAGSAKRAEEGAKFACESFMNTLRKFFAEGQPFNTLTREFVEQWLTDFQGEIQRRAETEGGASRDYACTLLAAVVADTQAVVLQIGDGAIVYAAPDAPDDYAPVFWPQKGEYENQTYFATDEMAKSNLQFVSKQAYIQEIALFSDGLQRLALHFQSETAHNPFFRTVFVPLRSAESGYSEALSLSLAEFLNSPQINQRTDDDKTLALATRRSSNEGP